VNVFTLNPEEKIILPGSSRGFELSSPARLNIPFLSSGVQSQEADQKSKATVFPSWQKPLIGLQNLEARVVYVDSDGQIAQQSSTLDLYFFPWKTLSLIIIPLLLFFGIFKFIKYKKAKLNLV